MLIALAVGAAALSIVDVGIRCWFPSLDRLSTNFSALYLDRELRSQVHAEPVMVLGDSVLWGYGIPSRDAAISRLGSRGYSIVNLSYEGGSLPNTYALLSLLSKYGIRPRLVVFNVNQKEFNPIDSAYRTLHPSVERLAWENLPTAYRDLLVPTQTPSPEKALERHLEFVWYLYGLRADERQVLFGSDDVAHAIQTGIENLSGTTARRAAGHRPTADRFEGTYDLTPLDRSNVGVRFLDAIGQTLQREHIPALAILTPTNHALLHEFIDTPEYEANLVWTRRSLKAYGIRVLDLDRHFPASAFLDNDHLTVAGNAEFADVLERQL